MPRKGHLKRMPIGADGKVMSAVRLTRLPCSEGLGTEKKGVLVPYPEPPL